MRTSCVILAVVAVTFGCDVPVRHYETMKCTPVGGSGSSCPKRYDCPGLTHHDNSKCYFNGKTYAVNSIVPNELVNPFCSALCLCDSGTPFALFRCTHIDCPEFFHPFDYNNCIRTYKPRSCCAEGKVCGKTRNTLAKCEVNGEQFLAGQRMSPKKCLNCICHKDFNEANMNNDPNCYETTCNFELHRGKQTYSGGAPVYAEDDCCPWEFRMPKDTDKLVEGAKKKVSIDTKLQCKYGKLTMNVGDTLVPEIEDEYTYKCSCLIPPMAQCLKTKNKRN